MVPSWKYVPQDMRTLEVRKYYNSLRKKKWTLRLKRCFDVVCALILIVVLAIPMVIIAVLIKLDSKGSVFYRQERVTQYGKVFRIFKFRTMVEDADKIGAHVTTSEDPRITRMGSKLRKSRLDEFPQLFNVLTGDMTFVGTRPEALRYVDAYSNEMNATLLLPAGITSMTSIEYKDEDELLKDADDPDKVYVEQILPEKMKYNLEYIENLSLKRDWDTLIMTVKRVF